MISPTCGKTPGAATRNESYAPIQPHAMQRFLLRRSGASGGL